MIALLLAAALSRPYHPATVRDLAAQKVRQTHVHVEGFVTYIANEADGDLHVRVCEKATISTMDRTRCIVAECIPELPCKRPAIGAHVGVDGIRRYDDENGHKWAEIHPVEKLTVIK